MKKIKIEINQAKILSYEVSLDDEMPEVSATIGLFSGSKKISSFSLKTQNYFSESIKFDLPISLIEPIKNIAMQLETILIKECNKSFKLLKAPKK